MRHFLDLRSVLVAAATLAVIVGIAFGALAATLGRPARTDLLAVETIRTLEHYIASSATMTVDGKHHTTVCTQFWGHHGHVETVVVDHRRVLRMVGRHLLAKGKLALGEFELSGCPRALSAWLTSNLNEGNRISERPTRIDRRLVYELRIHPATLELTIFVTRADGLPVALAIGGRSLQGLSAVTYHHEKRPFRLPLW